MKYVQSARVNYWEQCGMSQWYTHEQIGPMLLSASCHFKKPLYYPGEVTIQTRMEYMKQTSFSLHHILLNEAGEEVATATDIMVWYNFKTEKKEPLSDEIRQAVSSLEQFDFTSIQS